MTSKKNTKEFDAPHLWTLHFRYPNSPKGYMITGVLKVSAVSMERAMVAVRDRHPGARFERVVLDGMVDIVVEDTHEEAAAWKRLTEE